MLWVRKHHSPEDIVWLLRRIDQILCDGSTIEVACRDVGASTASYKGWRRHREEIGVDDAKEFIELWAENIKLKRLVTGAELATIMLSEIAKREF